ncbi:MAG: hypothetical protein ABWZ99_09675, partial [Ilumatobacteraceae bacterium]
MGTRNSRLRRRATKRGLASFVSFLLLFAFALGQSSLSALADDASTDPVAAEDLVSDGRTDGETAVAASPREVAAEEAAAEEAAAEEAATADTSSGGGAATTSGTHRTRTQKVASVGATAAPAAAAAALDPG